MGKDSKIAWCDHTFNTWWGCTRVSEACRNCYAETWAKRTGFEIWGNSGARRFFGEKHWNQPVKWNKEAKEENNRKRVFCASMCDVFEQLPENHPDAEKMCEARKRLWILIEETPNLDWLLLTKRPENINKMIPEEWSKNGLPENVWAGTTAEDQKTADERVIELLSVKSKTRFLSCEPLLGNIDFKWWLTKKEIGHFVPFSKKIENIYGKEGPRMFIQHGIDWIIVGGESGANSREMKEEWVQNIYNQCKKVNVPFFMKQMGSIWAKSNGLLWPNKGDSFKDIPYKFQVREFPNE